MTYLFKMAATLALERQACSTWSRQKEADFTLLCIVWLQCFFGIKHSLLLWCAPGQIHLCPVAQLHHGAGSLVFKVWNSLLPFLQKFVLSLSKYLPTFLPRAGPCGEHKDESDMGPIHKCCQSSRGHLAIGQAHGSFYHEGPQSGTMCCVFLEGEGD